MQTVVREGKTQDGHEYIIRYPAIEDSNKMCDYINELSKERTYISFQGEQLSYEEEERYVRGLIEKINDGNAMTLLLIIDDEICGISGIDRMTRGQSHVGIFGISLRKEYRGQKLGTILMETTINEAKNKISGLRIVTLGILENNEPARGLYKKMGFKEYGVLPKGFKYRDELVDHRLMYLEV